MSTLAQRRDLLPRLLKAEGLDLLLATNWRNRTRPWSFDPDCIMIHWTATPSASPTRPMPTLGVVMNGHANLPGPLYHILVGQDGRVALIHVQAGNHGGRGNSTAQAAARAANRRLAWDHRPDGDDIGTSARAWGISADHTGSGSMPPAQLDAIVKAAAAVLKLEGWGPEKIYHHAASTRRKVDVRGWPDLVRLTARYLHAGLPPDDNDNGIAWRVPIRGRILRTGGRLYGERDSAHRGVDIHAPPGTPVWAVAAGTVSHSASGDTSGNWVGIRHPDGWTTRYHHLDRRRVRAGDRVAAGEVIGDCGDTGRAASGPHLHLELRRTQSSGQPWNWPAADPATRLPGMVAAGKEYPGGEDVGDEFSSSPIPDNPRIVVRPNDRGRNVYRLQCGLRAENGDSTDLGGIRTARYGPQTLNAVHSVARRLRTDQNPSPTYTVGPMFIDALCDSVVGKIEGNLSPGAKGNQVYRLQHMLEMWRPGILGVPLGGWNSARYAGRTLSAVHRAARQLRGQRNPSTTYTVGPKFWAALAHAIKSDWGA